LSLIDAPEEKLIDCNDGRSAPATVTLALSLIRRTASV
jgi:hypothetical protein